MGGNFLIGPWPWPVTVVCRVPMVMFQLRGLKVHVRVLWSMSWGQMKAGSDWCLFLPLGEESSELGSMDDSLDGNDAGGEHDGDLDEYHLGGDEGGVGGV